MSNPYGPLFDDDDALAPPAEPAVEKQEQTYGVLELNQAIETALARGFPGEIWIRGEIQGLGRTKMRRHWYFELVEKDANSDSPKSRIPVALLQWNRSGVEREMRAAPGFDLEDDLEVRIRCKVGYYAPWGKLQLTMVGVDPAFTLGQMAANRERLLRALAAEDLLDRNAGVELVAVPQTIGLITSVGSAAYNDFVKEIGRGAHGFRVQAIDARVQGADMEATIVAGLRHFARHRPDVVVLIRGGGSRSDLAGFDSEAIARAIAQMPVAVLTGIGHEIDTSIADAVSYRAFKTPTACAAALVDRAARFVESVESTWSSISEHSLSLLSEQEATLARASRELARGTHSILTTREQVLGEYRRRIGREAPQSLIRREQRLLQRSQSTAGQVRLRLGRGLAKLDGQASRMSVARLQALVSRRQSSLDSFAARLRLLDPKRVLARGYSLSYDGEGKLLRGVAQLELGQQIHTVLGDGSAVSRVESIRDEGDDS